MPYRHTRENNFSPRKAFLLPIPSREAYEKLIQDQTGEDAPRKIVGPKTLNLYGAPYIWAVFMGIGLIEETVYVQEEMDLEG